MRIGMLEPLCLLLKNKSSIILILIFKQGRWDKVYETAKEWVEKMTTLVECWNKLEGNVDELSSWVNQPDTSAKDVTGADADISIEKLEGQLTQLKLMFAEKQKLVGDLEAYGPAAEEAKPAEPPVAEA